MEYIRRIELLPGNKELNFTKILCVTKPKYILISILVL